MSYPKRVSPTEARTTVAKKWNAHRANWLIGGAAPAWPLSIGLHGLTERDVLTDLPGTREWVASWRQWRAGGGTVEWNYRRWSSGDQELPSRLVLESAEEMATFLGVGSIWTRAKVRYAAWCARFPRLEGSKAIARVCDEVLLGYDDSDFSRLTALLQWLCDNPTSGLYLRQLPVADVDTKWVWPRRGIVQALMREISGGGELSNFYEICGLRSEPSRIRMRVLCPRLRSLVGGLCDIEAPVVELARLQLEPSVVLIVENINTGIALPDIDGAVVFMGLGLAVQQLEAIDWLFGADTHLYWGDLDTHGFAILARARKRLPRLISVLMDESTLLTHRHLWVREPTPCRVESPEGLTPAELDIYDGLRSHRWDERVRLEQERIAWPVALQTIRQLLEEQLEYLPT